MRMPLVIVQIVNYNGEKLLGEILYESVGSVFSQSYPNFIVHILDNASADKSADELSRRFPAAKISRISRNTGYCANNFGLKYFKYSEADYLLVMNNDLILEKDCLKNLVEHMESNPSLGGANPLILMNRKRDVVWSGGLKINKAAFASNDGFLKNIECYIPSGERLLNGACMILRRDAVIQTRLFDFAYGSYYEDADLSLRILGETIFTLGFSAKALCMHEVSASYSRASNGNDYLMLRNQYLLILKRFPFPSLIAAMFHLLKSRFLKRNILHARIFFSLFLRSFSILSGRISSAAKRRRDVRDFLDGGFSPYPGEERTSERTRVVDCPDALPGFRFPEKFAAGVTDGVIGKGFSMLTDSFPVSRRVERSGTLCLSMKKGEWIVSGYPEGAIVKVKVDGELQAEGALPVEFSLSEGKERAELVIEASSPVNITYAGPVTDG